MNILTRRYNYWLNEKFGGLPASEAIGLVVGGFGIHIG